MGLDGVELVMDVESAFDVSIPDEDAGRITTVGDLHQLVVGLLPQPRERVCLGARLFRRLRRDLVERGVHRGRVRLDGRFGGLMDDDSPGMLRIRHATFRGPTLRDVVREQRASRFRELAAAEGAWHPCDVWDALVVIIRRTLRIEERRIRREARFVQDLGID